MAISVIRGEPLRRGGNLTARETFSQSAATAYQALTPNVDISILGTGNSTGFDINRYSLAATGVTPRTAKYVLTTGTGEAKLFIDGSTATGAWVFSTLDSFLKTEFIEGKWRIIQTTATVASAT